MRTIRKGISMKSALAPTADLATPKIEKFVNTKLLPSLGHLAILDEFYACEPCVHAVENHDGNQWLEGNWGAKILCQRFDTYDLDRLAQLSTVICVNDATIYPSNNHQIVVNLWLSARVMR